MTGATYEHWNWECKEQSIVNVNPAPHESCLFSVDIITQSRLSAQLEGTTVIM